MYAHIIIVDAKNIYTIKKTKEMHSLAHRGDYDSLREIFDLPRNQSLIDINSLDANGDSILHIASKNECLSLVQLCLDLGSDPFLKNRKGKIPFEVTKDDTIRNILREAPMVKSKEQNLLGANSKIEGFLNKWTNYAEGYRRRWFVLENGVISYFKNQLDYPVSCRGSLNLQFAHVTPHINDKLRFEVIGVNSSIRYHLRADNAADAKRWIIAINQSQMALSNSPNEKKVSILATGLTSPVQGYFPGQIIQNTFDENYQNLDSAVGKLKELILPLCGKEWRDEEYDSSAEYLLGMIRESMMKLYLASEDWARLCENESQQRQIFEDSLRSIAMENHKLEIWTKKKLQASNRKEEEFYDVMDIEEIMEESQESEEYEEQIEERKEVESGMTKQLEELCVEYDLDFINEALKGYPLRTRKELPNDSTRIPPINLWSILKNMLGKDLFKIPLPINFCEPLSLLQRLCEEMEYSELLDKAASAKDVADKLMNIALFAISGYCSTENRAKKPFNPLLGETFEFVSREKGFRYISEQVSHHPPISACHAESKDWIFWSEANVKNKFTGKSLELIPEGITHFYIKSTGEHFIWKKVKTAVYNLIVGKPWLDHYGTMRIEKLHDPNNYCEIEFKPAGWLSSASKEVKGVVYCREEAKRIFNGHWNSSIELESGNLTLWQKNALPHRAVTMYRLSYFALGLNEICNELKIRLCPTDSRFRPDQRAMEKGEFERADQLKIGLEESQRERRKSLQFEPKPRWFEKHNILGISYWKFNDLYWQCRKKEQWADVPNIFTISNKF